MISTCKLDPNYKTTFLSLLFILSQLIVTSKASSSIKDKGGGNEDGDDFLKIIRKQDSSLINSFNDNPFHLYIPSYKISSSLKSNIHSNQSQQLTSPTSVFEPTVYHLVVNLNQRNLDNRFLNLVGPLSSHISQSICVQVGQSLPVDIGLCDDHQVDYPKPDLNQCDDVKCPPSWIIENWSQCSVTCGTGYQYRSIFCIQKKTNHSLVQTPDYLCPSPEPPKERLCNINPCPEWFVEPWSKCSVTCGNGHQYRKVTCREVTGEISDQCNNSTKPKTKRSCALPACSRATLKTDSLDNNVDENNLHSVGNRLGDDDDGLMTYRLTASKLSTHETNSDPGNGYKSSTTSTSISPWDKDSSQPKFFPEEWGSCTGICGTGIRQRKVHCKIMMDFSKILSIVPDDECIGDKPVETEECKLLPCPDSDGIENDNLDSAKAGISEALISSLSSPSTSSKFGSYSWKTFGFTECSASCLGGTQEEVIECVRDYDQMVVQPYLCNIDDKPDSITKTCNDHPCPPRWNISDFGPCSKPCGVGIQTREVNCIHEVTRGSENTLIVPDDRCNEPKPIEERVCNEAECPKLVEQTIDKPDRWSYDKCKGKHCPAEVKPIKSGRKCKKDSRNGSSLSSGTGKCNKKKSANCKSGKCKSQSGADENNNVDHVYGKPFIQTLSDKKVSLKVGGTAVIYEGTTLKVRCPRRKDSSGMLPEIYWTKNDLPIDLDNDDDRVSITRLGALKIHKIKLSDAGNYACSHGSTKLSMTVQVITPKLTSTTSPVDGESFQYATINKDEINKVDEDNILTGKIKPEPPYEVTQEMEKSSLHKLSSYFKNRANNNNNQRSNGQDADKVDLDGGSNFIEPRGIYFADQQSNYLSNNNIKETEARSRKARKPSSDEPLNSWDSSTVRPSSIQSSAFESRTLLKKFLSPGNSSFNEDTIYGSTSFRPDDDNSQSTELAEGKLEWFVSSWSNCSQPCGGLGVQIRARKCLIKFKDSSKATHDDHCIKKGLDEPEIIKSCYSSCPKWKIEPWGKCSNCVEFDVAKQSRSVTCVRHDQTLPNSECDKSTYPATSQTCTNIDCRPMWSTEDWKMCSGVCGKNGTQTRSVKCVWLSDQVSEAKGCDESKKPITVRKCNVNCDNKQSDCQNSSFLCQYAKPDSCAHPTFMISCCKSCRYFDFIKTK
ncbi:ADAMTS-like protein 1 [Tetranychus urticae]|uniref:Ig-like domain-containing protein n=1 Tax=Tetranychus urticae TaxID=32264 RepID=T1KRD8_TETUR|nr:ADAMTS-like protein 1 [Tetranychus urticae]